MDVGLVQLRRASVLSRVRPLSPLHVAALVTAVYGISLAGALAHHHASDFAYVGQRFVERPGTSRTITEHAVPTKTIGYDGQFALFIALDPAHAGPSIDGPAYRYSHILYPIAARAIAAGRPDWIPATLLLVNVAAVFFGTLALGIILRRERRPVWWAAAFGLFPGTVLAFDHDVGDLLAYSLVATGVLALRWGLMRRVLLAGIVFALAGLARESALFFPAVLALAHVFDHAVERRRRATEATILAVVAAAPYAVWRLFLLRWLGPHGSFPQGLARYPLGGLNQPWTPAIGFNLIAVVVPGLLLFVVTLRAGLAHRRSPFFLALVLQLLVFVVFLPAASYADYSSAARLQIGIVVAALCAGPVLRDLAASDRRMLFFGLGLAMAPSLLCSSLLSGAPI
jgi:hypothetical protein